MPATDISTFATTQLSLLSAELAAETASTTSLLSTSSPSALQRAGLALLNLTVSSRRTGLGGKTVLELEVDSAIGGSGDDSGLPEHGIRVGDVVAVRELVAGSARKREKAEADKKGTEGVVVRVGKKGVQVALGREDEGDGEGLAGRLWMVKLANEATYKRMNQTMEKLQKLQEKQQSEFVRVMFGQASPTPLPQSLEAEVGATEWITEGLNDSQKDAIRFALASREIALIHGPPGTGKTHTLIELILQLLKKGQRLLVCGPSNISVDNIVERLAPHKVPMVRLGHPARLLPSVLNHSLDILTKTSDAAALVQDVRKEMDEKQASIRKTRNGRDRRAIYGELRELRTEYRERERGCVDNLVQTSKVVLATLHGAGGYQLRQAQFDVVIIDEASQALEAQCWVALLAAKKVVLAGDHLQLPPTIKSLNTKTTLKNAKVAKPTKSVKDAESPNDREDVKDAQDSEAAQDSQDNKKLKDTDGPITLKRDRHENGTNGKKGKAAGLKMTLETTLFDRLLTLHGSSIKRMLTTQYRMHERIMEFPSQELYESRLIAAEAVKRRLLCELPGVSETEETTEPLIFYDTQGGNFPEKAEEDDVDKKSIRGTGESKSNEMEAALVGLHVRKLIEAGLQPEDIAVITPYNAQLSLLSQALRETFLGIELGSVDGFQGREKEAVIFSLVRSNPEHEVGFLAERRRLNVAMTRPRRQLTVIGDSETISRGGKFLKKWMVFLEEHSDLRYPDPSLATSS